MAEFEAIKNQLQSFIRKYQLNLLIKNTALFILIGLLFWLLLVLFENFIWFDTSVRFLLFLFFIIVESALLIFFIGLPLIKFLDIRRGISDRKAAVLIGDYFPEIDDRLLNLIELKSQDNSEFLQAAIHQKSLELKFYNFKNAVSFGEYLKYVLAAGLPLLLILALMISGRGDWLFSSFDRLKNYDQVYEKPAPFSFVLKEENLRVIEGEDYNLEVNLVGDEIPGQLKIIFKDSEYFMRQLEPGRFTYTFKNITKNQEFRLLANNISSRTYNLAIIAIPELVNFNIEIVYPNYLGLEDEQTNGEGNLTIPEGTWLKWRFEHRNTETVNLEFSDTLVSVKNSFESRFLQSVNYTLSTSNSFLKNYQPLSFRLEIIKDKLPSIQVEEKVDSLNPSLKYYGGKISDDHGISGLMLRYREIGEESFQSESINFSPGTISQFYVSFPGDLDLKAGRNYEYFFQVFDNDAVNGRKSASSSYFTYYKKTAEEIRDQNLQGQEENIGNLSDELDKFKQEDQLNNLLNDELENKDFDYEQQQKLESFIKSQERENALMKKFSKNIKDKLDTENLENDKGRQLKERLENTENKLQDNKALLNELKEYSDKIQNENLQRKLQELSKNKNSSKRSLEQLVELTKQYYVEQKYNQLVDKLDNLGDDQMNLDKSGKSQKEIDDKFDEIQRELDQLDTKNGELKRPKSLERNKETELDIQEKLENLNNTSGSAEREKKNMQENTGHKMKELAKEMKQSSANMDMQTLEADIESLRKVLDNLVIFSFKQENLMNAFREINTGSPEFSSQLKEQYVLKENFEHVDDSLFALGLNNQFIAEKVFEFLENVSFNLNNSLEELADLRLSKALSSQQYTITGANDLAVLLNEILDNMNDQMSSSGSGGEGTGPQLQDIIEKQQDLGQQLKEQMGKNMKGEGQENTDEGEHSKLFEIYKQQEEIRRNLERILKENDVHLNDLNQDYDELEKDILNNDFNQNSLNTLNKLNQKMLDLKGSLNEKGERNERESKTSMRDFDNQSPKNNIEIKDYFNSIEILDRHSLPLRPNLKQRVNTYFND
jgi:hypothetical protein